MLSDFSLSNAIRLRRHAVECKLQLDLQVIFYIWLIKKTRYKKYMLMHFSSVYSMHKLYAIIVPDYKLWH